MSENQAAKPGFLFGFLVTLLFVVIGAYVYQSWIITTFREIEQARLTISTLQQEIRTIRMENEKLRATIRALGNNDPAAWEEATRKYLGWVKPGEVVIESDRP